MNFYIFLTIRAGIRTRNNLPCSMRIAYTNLVSNGGYQNFICVRVQKLLKLRSYCMQRRLARLVNTATTKCSEPNVLPVTWSSWRQRCTDACHSVAASKQTSVSSAAKLTSSSTCTGAAPAGASVTSACPTRPSIAPSLATKTSRATWRSHTRAFEVRLCLRYLT